MSGSLKCSDRELCTVKSYRGLLDADRICLPSRRARDRSGFQNSTHTQPGRFWNLPDQWSV